MKTIPVYLNPKESQAIFATGQPSAAFLYLFLRNGNTIHDAKTELHLTESQVLQALEVLPFPLIFQHDRRDQRQVRRVPRGGIGGVLV